MDERLFLRRGGFSVECSGFQLLFHGAAIYIPGQRPQLPSDIFDYAVFQYHCQLSGQPCESAGAPGGAEELLYGTLLESSQKFQKGRTEWDCLRLAAEQLNRMFGRPILYALDGRNRISHSVWSLRMKKSVLSGLSSQEIGVAKWVQKNNKHAGATTNTLPDSKWLFCP